jgi:hypothetical protein
VEVLDAAEDSELSDEDELDRWAVLRGMSILETSSALMVFRPLAAPLGPRHPDPLICWKLGGGATAVICNEWQELEAGLSVVVVFWR